MGCAKWKLYRGRQRRYKRITQTLQTLCLIQYLFVEIFGEEVLCFFFNPHLNKTFTQLVSRLFTSKVKHNYSDILAGILVKRAVLTEEMKMVEITYFVSPHLSVGPISAVLLLRYMKVTLLIGCQGAQIGSTT